MKVFSKVIIWIVILLSFGAGLAKVMLTPQEVQFLSKFGFSNLLIILFGLIQILGSVLTVFSKTKIYGLSITAIGFMTSSLFIFLSENYMFGIVSLLPVILAIYLVRINATSN